MIRIGLFLIIVILGIIGMVIKMINKSRMTGALGRSVGDHELASLNSWMDVVEKEDEKRAQNGQK